MRYRVAILSALVLTFPHLAPGQTAKSPLAEADRRIDVSKDNQVIFDVRRVTLDENFFDRIGVAPEFDADDQKPKENDISKATKLKAPDKWSSIVYNRRQTLLLLNAANGDRRSYVDPTSLTIRNNEEQEWSPFVPNCAIKVKIRATMHSDRKAVQIRLIWPKRKDGKDALPVTVATLPAEASLLVPVRELVENAHNRQQEFLLITPHLAPADRTADQRIEVSKDNRLALEVRRITVPDNLFERIGAAPGNEVEFGYQKPEAPKRWSFVVYDEPQTRWFLDAAAGDRRLNTAYPITTIAVPNAKEHHWSPCGASCEIRGAIQTAASKDRKAVEVRLTWAKRKDGKEQLPATTATVPAGSSLLVQTDQWTDEVIASVPGEGTSICEEILCRLFDLRIREISQRTTLGFLLITPRTESAGKK